MAKFEKCNYNIACMGKNNDDNINIRNVDGYSFLVPVNEAMVKFCTHRDTSGHWEITDFATGFKTTGTVFSTRKGAFEHAISKEHIAALEKYLKDKPNLYAAQAAHFTKLLNGEKFTVKEYRESVEKMRNELTKAQQDEKKEKSMTDTKKNTKNTKKAIKRTRINGWVVYGTTNDGSIGWVSYADHKTNAGAEKWLARIAETTDDTKLKSVKSEFVGSAKERDEKQAEAKATLKKLCDEVVTWTAKNRKDGLKSTWTADKKKAAPKPPKNAAQPKPEVKPEPKPETDTAIAITLDTMREWCNKRTDVIATQKREGAIVRINGETKPYKEELKGLGFKWSKKGFWWARPTA